MGKPRSKDLPAFIVWLFLGRLLLIPAAVSSDGSSYTLLNHVPETGVLYPRCSDPDHVPDNHAGW